MTIRYFSKKNLPLYLIILIASLVFLTNLGGQPYSLDEPHTVVIGRTILTHGFPSLWDGRAFLTTVDGRDFTLINGHYFWTWHPWLQFYLIAPFYYLFENSIAMMRFPFALLGVITVAVFYQVTQELFKRKWLSILLSLQLIFLVPYFLYVRQVRYYGPSAFFSILIFWTLLRLFKNKFDNKTLIIFSLASLLLLATNYLTWLSCMAIFLPFALWKRKKSIFIIFIIEAILLFMWFHFFTPFGGSPQTAYISEGSSTLILKIVKYISYINSYFLPIIIFPAAIFAAWKLRMLPFLWIILLWIVIKIILYALLLDVQGRYLTDLAPICLLLLGFIYYYLWKQKQYVVIGLLIFVTTVTNILSLIPAYLIPNQDRHFRFIPNEIKAELIGVYEPASHQVGNYLSKKAKPNDIFWTNNYKWDIYLVSDVIPITSYCDTKTNRFIGPQIVTKPEEVRWFIFFQYDTRLKQSLTTVPCMGPQWQKVLEKEYTKKIFPLKQNTYNVNDPDIYNRLFPPNRILQDTVIIYEKK